MSHDLLASMKESALLSPAAALTTHGPHGLRSRLVHPLWIEHEPTGYVLTDGKSPKARDLGRFGDVTLTYHHDGRWWMISANTVINHDPVETSRAVMGCPTHPGGYVPANFWTTEELTRLIMVELHLTAVQMARFTAHELEVKKWTRPKDWPNPS